MITYETYSIWFSVAMMPGMYRTVSICCCYLGFVSSCVDARELSTYTVCGELRGLGGTYQQYRCV